MSPHAGSPRAPARPHRHGREASDSARRANRGDRTPARVVCCKRSSAGPHARYRRWSGASGSALAARISATRWVGWVKQDEGARTDSGSAASRPSIVEASPSRRGVGRGDAARQRIGGEDEHRLAAGEQLRDQRRDRDLPCASRSDSARAASAGRGAGGAESGRSSSASPPRKLPPSHENADARRLAGVAGAAQRGSTDPCHSISAERGRSHRPACPGSTGSSRPPDRTAPPGRERSRS